MEDKRTLRLGLLGKKLRLSRQEVEDLSDKVIKKLISHIDWKNIHNIHAYIPIEANNELDTWPLIKFIQQNHQDIEIYLPKLDGFARYNADSRIEENRLGIPEPLEKTLNNNMKFDLVIVPAIGFDRRGFRLGYGAGYYDKFLAKHKCRQVIGLAYSFSEVDKIPEEPHDKKMHEIITEKEIITAQN